jgi:hypothetical protein
MSMPAVAGPPMGSEIDAIGACARIAHVAADET